jgi:catechol 2,3-dioxygenase-like lactoylglutathione lyase family enzyme
MFDHITIGVRDIAASRAFYDQALAPLGIRRLYDDGESFSGYGTGDTLFFWIADRPETLNGVHVAFVASDHAVVDAFHAAALAAGGEEHGAPGLRPHYGAHYYAAFVLDPDEHNIEAVYREPARWTNWRPATEQGRQP